jgi:hypothetical protein
MKSAERTLVLSCEGQQHMTGGNTQRQAAAKRTRLLRDDVIRMRG